MATLAKRSAQLCDEAVKAHRQGQLGEAQSLYEKALALRPRDVDTLNYLGVLRHHQGQSAVGVELIESSLKIAPRNEHAWLNLGHVMLDLGRAEQARAAYERACALEPKFANAWFHLGLCLRRMQAPIEAISAFDRAVALRPSHALSWYQRGVAKRETGDFVGAEADYRAALELESKHFDAYESLGVLLYRQGRMADAAQVYRSWLEHDPQSARAKHMAAATSGENSPERAPDDYIVETFDRFAETFDADLTSLGYRAPELVAGALRAALPPGSALAGVLDAGCGTGLCGPLLRPISRQLVGVDLSAAMAAKARAKNCYDEVHVSELCEFMRARTAAFDALVAADTLVYFGALEEALAAAAACLKAGGHLVMTLEALAEGASAQKYRIEPHGRYSHRIDYVSAMLEHSGFDRLAVSEQVLRRERGEDVQGLIVTARRPSSD